MLRGSVMGSARNVLNAASLNNGVTATQKVGPLSHTTDRQRSPSGVGESQQAERASTSARKPPARIPYHRIRRSMQLILSQGPPLGFRAPCNRIGPSQSYIPRDEISLLRGYPGEAQSRVCGLWVEVLPTFNNTHDPNGTLSTAVESLFTSIVSHGPGKPKLDLDPTQAYYKAIHILRKSFSVPGHHFTAEFAAAVMCLCLTELMLPQSSLGPAIHTKAVSGLFQAHGPGVFSSGISHKLFAGFLPLLIIDAFISRQPTFLAREEWKRQPFSVITPSVMQKLLIEAANIPTILHRIDQEIGESTFSTASSINSNLSSIMESLTRLELFEASVNSGADGLYYQEIPTDRINRGSSKVSNTVLWFPNITIANMFTHLWAFKIVCITEIDKLTKLSPIQLPADSLLPGDIHVEGLSQRMVKLSQSICRSMEYLMQDTMALYGPASTFYPLQIAYKTLRGDPLRSADVTFCEQVVERLVQKGLRVAPDIVFAVLHYYPFSSSQYAFLNLQSTFSITHVGTATAIFEIDNVNFLTDPFFPPAGTTWEVGPGVILKNTETPALNLENLPPIDAILLNGAKSLASRPAVRGLKPWETKTVHLGGKRYEITATPCQHLPGGECTGFILTTEDFGLNGDGRPNAIYFTGDAVFIDELAKIPEKFHVVAPVMNLGSAHAPLPEGPLQITMDGRQAAHLFHVIQAECLVPMHYESWGHFTQFGKELVEVFEREGVSDKVRWLTPGQSVKIL
ncbi:hypothetical protein BBP40_011181 [Aspergillus hancockii]|nr:hypothetical protein BBP40_011181 [Aspergillus hancockii]